MGTATIRPGGRTARVREDVLGATLDLLQEVGMADLTIEGISERSGVHRTTIHRRWPSRTALVADALLEVSAVAVPIPDTGQLRSDLRIFAQHVRDVISTPLAGAIMTALAQTGPASELNKVSERFWTTRFAANRAIVERAIERRDLPRRTDPRLVIEALGGPIWFRTFVVGDKCDNRFIDGLVDMVIAGLERRAR
jgi:AcrR family transcriptional regulator